MRAFIFLLLFLAVLWWWWGLKQSTILFTVMIRDGKVSRVRGRIPPRLMSEIRDIVSRAGVTQARFVAVSRDGAPVLHFKGEMDPGLAQQMRNVVGQFSVGEIRSGQEH
ncbi:MAG TPA: DUF3634 family protein [Polyangiaceae bacterium]|nr:DUF3634 family protein [Polyangiaceae bacterium]